MDTTAAPVPASLPPRPQMPPRASSERVRSTPPAPLRPSNSVRTFVRLASLPETSPAPATLAATTTLTTRSERASSVTNRTSTHMQSMRMTPTSVAPLMRAVSSMLRLNGIPEAPHEETFRCHICFDDVGVSEAVTLSTCGHKYCESCFKPYLELKITEGNIRPVCFHPIEETDNANGDTPTANVTCGVAVSEDQIKAIVDPEIFKKYEYFRFNQEHQHARECPYCAHSQDCAGPENPICVCEQCSKTFCFFHGNAHEDGTCADYELKNAQEEALNRAKIDEIAKPCPGCHRDVEKNGGCNHMKCIGCNTSFCWLCGEIIEDTPTPMHYAAEGGSCSGRQFDGMETTPPTWQQWCILILFSILTVPPAFVLSVVLSPLLWLCMRQKSLFEVFVATQTVLIIVLCAILGLALTPVGWVIDICVAIIVFVVVVIVELFKLCCCCCCSRTRQPESDPADTEPPMTNDLETGLIAETDGPKQENGNEVRAGDA